MDHHTRRKSLAAKRVPHQWLWHPLFRVNFCIGCGLVWLKNVATAKAAAKPCEGE